MATSFPGGIDSLTNPISTDKLNNPDHAGQHSNVNDGMEAVQAKVGADSSAVVTSHDYMLDNAAGRFKAHDHSGDDSENSSLLPLTMGLPNDVYYEGRNAADSGDVSLIKADASDAIIVGENDSNDHTVINAGTSKLVKIKVLRQDDTSNSYEENTVILSGWGYMQGDGVAVTYGETVTFGITFSQAPVLVLGYPGYKLTTAPTSIADFTNQHAGAGFHNVGSQAITTTQFTAVFGLYAAAPATQYNGYSWLAVGELN